MAVSPRSMASPVAMASVTASMIEQSMDARHLHGLPSGHPFRMAHHSAQ